MSDDFCRQIYELYQESSSLSSSLGVSLSSSSGSVGLSSSGGGGVSGSSTTGAGGGGREIDAAEILRNVAVPRAIKLFGKRAAMMRCVQIAIVACGMRAAFIDFDFSAEELNKGSAKKCRGYEFVQFVQQLLPFIGFSLTPMSFKTNGTCLPIAAVWFDQRRIGWRDVHRLLLPDEFQDDVYSATMLGHTAPMARDTVEALSGETVYFNLLIASDECNLTPHWSTTLISEFVPHCLKNSTRLLAEKRARLENVAQTVCDRDVATVELIFKSAAAGGGEL